MLIMLVCVYLLLTSTSGLRKWFDSLLAMKSNLGAIVKHEAGSSAGVYPVTKYNFNTVFLLFPRVFIY